jgi:cobalt-precorrin 5A hydrolase/precorrin-3B C17-methyltransferase
MEPVTEPSRRLGKAVIAVTGGGARLGGEIAVALGPDAILHVMSRWHHEAPLGAKSIDGRLAEYVASIFPRVEALVFVLATGAAIRLVAPLLGNKQDDPAVLCIDESGRHVIPLLGGHQASANELARTIADAIGADPVVSTASDVLGYPALDALGRYEAWRIEASAETLKAAMAAVVAGETPAIFQDAGERGPVTHLPPEWPRMDSVSDLRGWPGPRLAITDRQVERSIVDEGGPLIAYRPPSLVLGVGCSTGAPTDEMEALARQAVAEAGLAWDSIGEVRTIAGKLTEPAVQHLIRQTRGLGGGAPAELLASVRDVPNPSDVVMRAVGTPSVCEAAALLGSHGGELMVPKRKSAHATVAVARRAPQPPEPGHLWLVGIGPGHLDLLTPAARRAIRTADVVIGYRAYLEMLTEVVAQRRMRPYGLGEERERAAEAIRRACEGQDVALVSSGDIGVYGMAGLVYELLAESGETENGPPPEIEVIPGVTAASSAGALLGAPLMLDFAAISLSDLLVPWDTVRQRLTGAAEGDLVVVLYNPASARRRQPLTEALAILRQHRSPETPVGLVREAYRPDQRVLVTTLGALPEDEVDMRTVVVIGCSRTAILDGRIVTRRGYLERRGPR